MRNANSARCNIEILPRRDFVAPGEYRNEAKACQTGYLGSGSMPGGAVVPVADTTINLHPCVREIQERTFSSLPDRSSMLVLRRPGTAEIILHPHRQWLGGYDVFFPGAPRWGKARSEWL